MNKEEILEELEIEIQNILAPYFIILDGRDDTQENIEIIEISKNISSKVLENYISKSEIKEKYEISKNEISKLKDNGLGLNDIVIQGIEIFLEQLGLDK